MKVYGKGLGVRAGFLTLEQVSPEERGWAPSGFVDGVFTHDRFPEHAVVERAGGRDWLVLQRYKGRPNLSLLLEAAHDALGKDVMPGRTYVFPRALRVPLTDATGDAVDLPLEPIRCRRIGDPRHVRVLGVEVELRLSATNAPPRVPEYYAEAFVGRHETYEGEPRSVLFLADLRHLFQEDQPAWVVKFATGMLVELFTWIDDLASIGLVPRSKPNCALPVIARTHYLPERHDVVFDLALRSLGETQRFLTHWTGWSTPVRSLTEVRHVLHRLAAGLDMFGSAFASSDHRELASPSRTLTTNVGAAGVALASPSRTDS